MRARLLAATAALLLTAACGGEPSPEPAPYKGPSKSSTPQQSAGQAATSLVESYITTLNAAGKSGDTSDLRAFGVDACRECTGVADFIDDTYEKGGQIVGEGWLLQRVREPIEVDGGLRVDAFVDVSPQDVTPSTGAAVKHFDGGTNVRKRFTLIRVQGAWSIAAIESKQ